MVLLSVALALRPQPAVSALMHVTRTMSSFLMGPMEEVTLARACELRLLALLDEIWTSSCTAAEDRVPYWTPRNFLRSDRHYNRWQFTQSLVSAVRSGHLEVVEWLYQHFTRCIAEAVVVKEAARLGRLEILRFMLAHDALLLDRKLREERLPEEGNSNAVVWSDEAVTLAAQNGKADVVRWLCTDASLQVLPEAIAQALHRGDYELANWMMSVGDGEEVSTRHTSVTWRDAVLRLEERGGMEELLVLAVVLEIFLKHDELEMARKFLNNLGSVAMNRLTNRGLLFKVLVAASKSGDLPLVKGLMECRLGASATFFEKGISNKVGTKGDGESVQCRHEEEFAVFLGRAVLIEAVSRGHLDIVLDVVTACALDPALVPAGADGHKKPLTFMDMAAANGHVNILQYFHELKTSTTEFEQLNLRLRTTTAAEVCAAAAGHLKVIQWLQRRRYVVRAQRKTMDEAAAGGHLRLVQWLHTVHSMGCTTLAMDKAAANGHLNVVQWLHGNRSEGCTSKAIDEAAGNGHMEVVQWLYENREECWTTVTLNEPAANNDMRMVHWLCENTTAGCTTAAMDGAAANGHLEMVRWLHAHTMVGCTKAAMDSAAANGHLKVVQWLATYRIEGCSRAAIMKAASGGHFEVMLYLRWWQVERTALRSL